MRHLLAVESLLSGTYKSSARSYTLAALVYVVDLPHERYDCAPPESLPAAIVFLSACGWRSPNLSLELADLVLAADKRLGSR